ncbi:sigma-70 family RNA polymerase sigma factor [Clostridium gasigenes]|uniref:sigma-70 family RNA polymerase sigma factor n=1 Tax=Clostridium gasigenes TaxID=94869 RepID=UPI00209AA17C|nr:sigma-70 family RNA polymerase sigma factor [Clostridium gasigenes]
MDDVATMKVKILNLKKSNQKSMVNKDIVRDRKYLGELIKNNKVYLYKIAYSYVKNQDDALEIIQECSYKAMLNIGKLKETNYFKTWITRILINCSIDFLKAKNNQISFNDEIRLEPITKSISIDEKLDLYKAIDLLNDKYKTVIILKYFNDMTIEDISKIIEIPQNTVKTYLRRAKNKLGNSLEEDYLNE